MRTNEEKIAALHKRANKIDKRRRQKRVRVICALAVTVCFAAALALAAAAPSFSAVMVRGEPVGEMSASIFSGDTVFGYVVVGVLSCLLGASVTVFCFRMKKWKEEKDEKDFYD